MPGAETKAVIVVKYPEEWKSSYPHGDSKSTNQPLRTTVVQQQITRDSVRHGKLSIQIVQKMSLCAKKKTLQQTAKFAPQ